MDVPLVIRPFGSTDCMRNADESLRKFIEVERLDVRCLGKGEKMTTETPVGALCKGQRGITRARSLRSRIAPGLLAFRLLAPFNLPPAEGQSVQLRKV